MKKPHEDIFVRFFCQNYTSSANILAKANFELGLSRPELGYRVNENSVVRPAITLMRPPIP